MQVIHPKYDLFANSKDYPYDVRKTQVTYLYYTLHKKYEEIAQISGYAVSTVKNYVSRFIGMEDMYDVFFNPDFPPLVTYERKPLPVFEDGYSIPVAPEDCGLYLMSSTHFDPITDKKIYCIKVGMSNKLCNRVRGYHSENPFAFLLDTIIFDPEDVGKAEHDCHVMLSDVADAIARDTDEWFIVKKEIFDEICDKKFKYFF